MGTEIDEIIDTSFRYDLALLSHPSPLVLSFEREKSNSSDRVTIYGLKIANGLFGAGA